jgi:cytochrome c
MRILLSFVVIPLLGLPLIHPFGPVREQHSPGSLPAMPLLQQACGNCHSERTVWPKYSYIPGISWMIERDVAQARAHMNLSHWDEYLSGEKRDLLAKIAAEVRSGEMPPVRYKALHPEARLSAEEIQSIYRWTVEQRVALRVAK